MRNQIILTLSITLLATQSFGYQDKDLERLRSTSKCIKCDLSEADLGGYLLMGASLISSNLTGAKLQGADLTNANLSEANLSEANLTTFKGSAASGKLIRTTL